MFSVLALIVVALALGFWGVPLFVWTGFAAALLYLFGEPTASCWYIFGAIALIANVPLLRRYIISFGIMRVMKNVVPAISQTERTALEAGVVWVEGELFSGKPSFRRMLKEPYPQLTREEQAFLDGPVDKLCGMINEWEVWKQRDLPKEAWDYIRKEKFLGMIIPKEYGGLGFSALAHSEVIKKISTRSVAGCISVMVPNSLGPAELLIHYGTQAQKDKYLRRLAEGLETPCFALTEPTAGSDAGSIQATGILYKGADGKLMVRLTWNKRWITLAAISTVLGLAFRMRDPENLLGKGEDLGITCALIPSNTPGVVLGRRHDPLGVPFYNCPTQGKDVSVSVEDCVVGGLAGVGEGWKMLMECLSAGRGISLPAQATGGVQLAARVCSAHSSIRKQFGLPIGKFEGVEESLARIGADAYMLEAARRYTCGALDQGIKPPVVTAIAKYNFTEIMRNRINDGMDILGGAGISRGPRNLLAGAYTALPIGITVEGANILTRTLMIFGQGALRAHPYAFKEVNAIEKGDLAAFDKAFWGHVGHVVRNKFRSVLLSVSRGWLTIPPTFGPTAQYYRKLSWASASFAIMTDIAMGTLGGKLKYKEQITGRFADIISWMYLAMATLRRFEAEGRRKEDLPYVHYSLQRALSNMQRAFDGLFSNMRFPGLTWFFRCLRFWSGFNVLSLEPQDNLTHAIAESMQEPSELRNRLADGVYIPKSPTEALGRLEATFTAVKQSEATDRKVRKAIREKRMPKIKGAQLYKEALAKGVITQDEFATIDRAEQMRLDAITVDDFSQQEYLGNA